MNCLICKTEATRIKTLGDWVELKCPDCGHFRVSGTLYAEMKSSAQTFDVDKARALLKQQRSADDEGHCAMIDTSDSAAVVV